MAKLNPYNSRQLAGDLAKNPPARVYIFTGEEEGEKDKFIKKISGMLFPAGSERSVERYYLETGEKDEFSKAAAFILSQSFFSTCRLCVIRDIDCLKSAGRDAEIFSDMIKSVPDGAFLIMTTKKNRPPDFISSLPEGRVKTVQFWRYFENDIKSYIISSFKSAGLQIEQEALSFLLGLTGNDIRKIDEAVDMVLLSGFEKNISRNQLRSVLHDTGNATVFEFVNAFFKKSRSSLYLLKKILDSGTPGLMVLSLLLKQAESLEKYYMHIAEGKSMDEAMKGAGVYSGARDDFLEYSRNFPVQSLAALFGLMAKADYELKSSSFSDAFISGPLALLTAEIITSLKK